MFSLRVHRVALSGSEMRICDIAVANPMVDFGVLGANRIRRYAMRITVQDTDFKIF